jgi:hypothetical protein
MPPARRICSALLQRRLPGGLIAPGYLAGDKSMALLGVTPEGRVARRCAIRTSGAPGSPKTQHASTLTAIVAGSSYSSRTLVLYIHDSVPNRLRRLAYDELDIRLDSDVPFESDLHVKAEHSAG